MNGARLRRSAAALCVLLLAAACNGSGSGTKSGGTLRILAGSELADLRPVLDRAEKDIGVTVKLDYAGTLTGVQRVLDGSAARDHDAIWFSSNSYLALHQGAQARLGPSVDIMSSPVLLGVRAPVAHRLGWDRTRPTWSAIAAAAAAGKLSYGMTSPVSSNSGFSALVGVAAALSGTGAALDRPTIDRVAPRLRGFFSAQHLTSGSSGWLSDAYAADPGRADGLINYESVLLSLNASRRLPEPLTLVYPADGAVTAHYPLTRLAPASHVAGDAFRALTGYLRRPDVQRRIMTLTHRRPSLPSVRPSAEFGAPPPELPFPNRADAADALIDAYVNRLRRPARTVYALDVSESMRGPRLAALKTALTALTGADASLAGRFQRFHDREEITLLPFSSTPQAPSSFVLPPASPEPELARIRAAAQGLAAAGGTAIYDALEQAYALAGTGSADRITSIVLMSDGEVNGGATLEAFRAWYARQPAEARRIPVFTVLFGESRVSEMNEVAALTHGKVFDARLQSLSAVFGEIRGYQ
ncbi:vWA domain-containing protein [Actinomadura physcomitrii]|uniref:vWA domain-containing protein n=1 Tax=Actinomadura physcomitrii TaxID=2650748 RepID=UPI002E25927C